MAKAIAHPDAPYLGRAVSTAGQLLRLLEEQGLSGKSEQQVIDDPEFRIALAVWWETNANPDVSVDGCTLAQAAQVMGDNFLGPVAVRRCFDPELTRQSVFKSVPFSIQQLEEARETHVLVAISALSLIDLFRMNRDLFNHVFFVPKRRWFTQGDYPFAHEKPEIGWYLVRTSVVPDSKKKTWDEMLELLGPNEFVPSASVLVQAAFLQYLWNHKRFLRDWFLTSDTTSLGSHLMLFQEDSGLCVYGSNPKKASSVTGLASAIKVS